MQIGMALVHMIVHVMCEGSKIKIAGNCVALLYSESQVGPLLPVTSPQCWHAHS